MALSTQHMKEVCKIGQGADCCKYLLCSGEGFECGKTGALKGVIDSRAEYMTAQGDNCDGVSNTQGGDSNDD